MISLKCGDRSRDGAENLAMILKQLMGNGLILVLYGEMQWSWEDSGREMHGL